MSQSSLPSSAGRTVVVTGASSGIGAAVCEDLASAGHRVFALARRADRLQAIASRVSNVVPVPCDVADVGAVAAAMARIGGDAGSLHGLVHCAGAYGPIGPVDQVDAAEWLKAVGANLFGLLHMVQAVVPKMKGADRPRIVVFSGGGAFAPLPRYSAYAAAKAATVRLMETMAQELAELGIAVNAVAPGFVATEIHDATLAAGPEQSGPEFYEMTRRKLSDGAIPMTVPVACVRWLLSIDADGLTGKTISASFDPWGTDTFRRLIPAITESDLYTMQRVNLGHLPSGSPRDDLMAAAPRSRR